MLLECYGLNHRKDFFFFAVIHMMEEEEENRRKTTVIKKLKIKIMEKSNMVESQ